MVSAGSMRKRPISLGMDYWLLLSFFGLLCLGVVMVTSASVSIAETQMADAFYFGRRQLMMAALGLLLTVAALRTPIWVWQKTGFIALMVSLGLLLVVLGPVGKVANGAQRWIDFGVITLQVSELARLGIILYLSGYLVRRGNEVKQSLSGFIKPIAVVLIAVVLLLAEPDFGAAAVLMVVTMGMLFLAGARLSQFMMSLAMVILAFSLLALTAPYRMARLMTFLDPWRDAFNSGYQLTQSLIAFGSGGWTGLGLGASVQKLSYLPEAHNDFLFAIIAEELGFAGVAVVLLTFAILVARIFATGLNAEKQNQPFAAYLCYGIALWVACQVFVNTGVSMGVLPTKGLTLPLVSAGGSAIIVMCLAMGMVMRVNLENCLATRQVIPGRANTVRRKAALSADTEAVACQ